MQLNKLDNHFRENDEIDKEKIDYKTVKMAFSSDSNSSSLLDWESCMNFFL